MKKSILVALVLFIAGSLKAQSVRTYETPITDYTYTNPSRPNDTGWHVYIVTLVEFVGGVQESAYRVGQFATQQDAQIAANQALLNAH